MAAPLKYAGFWIRLVAVMVDGLVLFAASFLVGLFMPTNIQETGLLGRVIFTLIGWVYYVWMTNSTQSTLGKKLVGIKVQSVDGQKLSLGKVIIRETIGKLLSAITLGIGYIMAAFTEKKQGLHDFMAKSVVIYKDPSKQNRTGLIIGIIIAAVLPALVILGILSSIVLVSLNSARSKGKDMRVISSLQQIRTVLESDYNGAEYPDLDLNVVNGSGPQNTAITMLIADINRQGSTFVVRTDAAIATKYVLAGSMPSISGGATYFCIDSTGSEKQNTTIPTTHICQ